MNKAYTLLSEIKPQAVTFLWGCRIPLGELTIIEGDPGTNKSSLTLDLAARVSTGTPMPGECKKSRPGGVLLLVAEDSIRKTLPLRLKAAGADMTRIAVMEDDVTIPKDLTVIERSARQLHARLLVIDPLMVYIDRNANADQSVRQALTPLKKFAERSNLAVVLVRHLSKNGRGRAMYRGSGSIGISAAARSVLLVGKSPADPNMRVVVHHKCNLGPQASSLLFEPETTTEGGVRIGWRGECEYTADELLAKPSDKNGKLDAAQAFLLDALAGGPVEQKKLTKMAAASVLAWRTVERAKEILGIVSKRKGWGPGSQCFWLLPSPDGRP